MVTIKEFAEIRGISPFSIYSAINRGTFHADKYEVDGKLVYLIDENTKYVSKKTDYKQYKGLSHHPLYKVWLGMKSRCYNPKASRYENYGGRGIQVCDEWRNNALSFIKWGMANGYQKGLQIDRINNDGNYEPSNCRWVTPKENANNRSNNLTPEKILQRKLDSQKLQEQQKAIREKRREEKRLYNFNKPFIRYQENIDAYRQGFETNLQLHKYKRAINNCDFDLLEKGVFDDLIEKYMLSEYKKYYNLI